MALTGRVKHPGGELGRAGDRVSGRRRVDGGRGGDPLTRVGVHTQFDDGVGYSQVGAHGHHVMQEPVEPAINASSSGLRP